MGLALRSGICRRTSGDSSVLSASVARARVTSTAVTRSSGTPHHPLEDDRGGPTVGSQQQLVASEVLGGVREVARISSANAQTSAMDK
jgi:hypothetical protein